MTFALKDLTRLLTPDALVVGSIVATNGSLVRIATERGLTSARTLEVLAVGDRVVIKSGMASKAPTTKNIFPV